MKTLIILILWAVLPAMMCFGSEPAPRNIKIIILGRKGKAIKASALYVSSLQNRHAVSLDRKGLADLAVKDPDTLTVISGAGVFPIPVPHVDTIILILKNKELYIANVVTDEVFELGYASVPSGQTTTPVKKLNMNEGCYYTDLASYLTGRVAGVKVEEYGGAKKVIIRGISTFTGDVGALIVVDGVSQDDFDLVNRSININDISSVDILMDGSGYGVRGSNGVVIITTLKQK